MAVTRNDVAKAAGVSPGVVSYVLNSGPRPVSAATRQRVLEAVVALGYKRDGLARSLRTGRSDTLGVILPDASNPFFAELARAIEDSAFRAGKSVLVCNSADDIERERSYLKTLAERRVDGIILVSASGEEDLSDVLDLRIPIVTMDRYRAETAVSTVRFDNRHAGYVASKHLIEHGHELITIISGPHSTSVSEERISGYLQALAEAGLEPLPVEAARFTFSGGYEAMTACLKLKTVPTAAVCSSDVQAIGALAALADDGGHAPARMALVSIDGTRLARFTRPVLTAVRQPVEVMADLAVRTAIEPDGEIHRTLQGELVAGGTCGCRP
ncbi:LacI family DNA-binding transcriptional regulator [Sinomonas sp.]|uniref:LacI family DNA-binding transcriptional regulator n=1 Tax=Sinomonas sp. TaxID=1914986 RepID=UPI003F811131